MHNALLTVGKDTNSHASERSSQCIHQVALRYFCLGAYIVQQSTKHLGIQFSIDSEDGIVRCLEYRVYETVDVSLFWRREWELDLLRSSINTDFLGLKVGRDCLNSASVINR
jgi:hypothetical protein